MLFLIVMNPRALGESEADGRLRPRPELAGGKGGGGGKQRPDRLRINRRKPGGTCSEAGSYADVSAPARKENLSGGTKNGGALLKSQKGKELTETTSV